MFSFCEILRKNREMRKKKRNVRLKKKKQRSYKNWIRKGAFLVQQICRSTAQFVLLIVILQLFISTGFNQAIDDEHHVMFTDFTADRFVLCDEQQQ